VSNNFKNMVVCGKWNANFVGRLSKLLLLLKSVSMWVVVQILKFVKIVQRNNDLFKKL
jgi:hypothetical protein